MDVFRSFGTLLCVICYLRYSSAKDTLDGTDSAKYNEEHPEEFGDYFEGDMLIDNTRNALIHKSKLWPGGRVYYIIDKNSKYTNRELNNIKKAMAALTKNTCIKLIERTKQKYYVRIFRGKGCYSMLGRTSKNSKPQPLSLGTGCLGVGTVIHEILHTLGFVHEQSRNDRDEYVKINYDNIQNGKAGNFKKFSSKMIQHLGAKYDYGSIMHYGKKAFSKNKKDTITPKEKGKRIGQRSRLSSIDIEKVNALYKCDA